MNEDLDNLQYSPIRDYDYAQFFQEIQYNGNTLSDSERKDFIAVIDNEIAYYSEGLALIRNTQESTINLHDEYYEVERTVFSVMFFVAITMIDSMVASKYFLLADKDYDRRYMRGKLLVILNEGFKRLYGFDDKTHKKSEWNRLQPIMNHFPEVIYRQYLDLTNLLDHHARSSSWWREERNLETHMDAEKLFLSRQEEVIESKVMIDSTNLINSLHAVDKFLTNVHGFLLNHLIDKYRRGDIKE